MDRGLSPGGSTAASQPLASSATSTIQPLEVEMEEAPRRRKGILFPIRMGACIPSFVMAFLPSTLLTIQDPTHLVIAMGIIACGTMVITSLLRLIGQFVPGIGGFVTCTTRKKLFCAAEVLSLVFLVPCLLYLLKLVQRYDEDMQKKQAKLHRLQAQAQELYAEFTSDMVTMLERQAECGASLAEKNFESKRRDFQRFLKSARDKFGRYFDGTKSDRERLTAQFKIFVKHWLMVFEECSLDPINAPRHVADADELERLCTIEELCDFALDRLTRAQVAFISKQQQEYEKEVQRIQETGPTAHKKALLASAVAMNNSRAIKQVVFDAWRMQTKIKLVKGDVESGGARALTIAKGAPTGLRRALTIEDGRTVCGCTWFRIGPNKPFLAQDDDSGYPVVCHACLLSLIVLSKEHGALMAGWVMGWVILGIAIGSTDLLPIITIAICTLTLSVVLIGFEDLDEVERLKRELEVIRAKTKKVEEKKAELDAFWGQVNSLTELWLHRTVPRLELIKEAHSHLEDAPPNRLVTLMTNTNAKLQKLENSVGPRSLWIQNGGISEQEKKAFGQAVMALSDAPDLDTVLTRVDQLQLEIKDAVRRASLKSTNSSLALLALQSGERPSDPFLQFDRQLVA